MTKNEWTKVLSKKTKRSDKPRNETGAVNLDKKQAELNHEAQKKSRSRKTRTEAVIIKPSDGKSYAEILKVIKANVKPEEAKTEV